MKLSSRVILLCLSAIFTAEAFTTIGRQYSSNPFGLSVLKNNKPSESVLYAEEEGDSVATEASEEEVEKVEEEQEEPPEDPEVVALKEDIKTFESELRAKRNNLSNVLDSADRYTQGGYARQVAQMEDMKRIRLSMQSSNKDTAKAGVVQNFLPVLEELEKVRETYKDQEFGSKYSGLTSAMSAALQELGVSDYTVKEGDEINVQRMQVVEEEYSEQFSKGTVIRPVSVGMEISGNVMQMAKVVGSLGSEKAEDETSEEALSEEETNSNDQEEEVESSE
eukprot:CAMPEP_0194205568 /NCGR_PEP_ID=MMETSP0156-20130528/4810_1 /TAXON_ID=33649 /ORGANISM="Thalassionema nitzschioides, Strain L26-B" /LENGTH=278 /DNA_ID=CAMNT_0038931871 /DNA_START=37 /DNA_END=873 /DNA_ORIENTATION=-